MNRLFLAAMVTVLSGVPVVSLAETTSVPQQVAAPAARDGRGATTSETEAQAAAGDEASEYAEREQAAPQLAEFSGGADGVYIGAGALVAILLVVLLVAAL